MGVHRRPNLDNPHSKPGWKRFFGIGKGDKSASTPPEVQTPPSRERREKQVDRPVQTEPASANVPDVPARELEKTGPSGFVTDQKMIRWFYESEYGKDANPVTTDKFLDKSKDQYNAAWLSRELVQNFVDHNPEDPGTLNGVSIVSEEISPGKRRYIIRGNWEFNDPTGVLSPHSEKPDDRNTAGGNGIGLKQAAIRLLRDFDVETFEIHGEGWKVDYSLNRAEDVNADMRERLARKGQSPMKDVQHDWLLADLQQTESRGSNAYVIDTSDPKIFAIMDQLKSIGVSKENPFLQDPDFENKHGAIKWLPLHALGKTERGRLFLNGQVMSYEKKGETEEDFWVGPEFMTLQLNNVKYAMNVDRPPVKAYELEKYTRELVNSMDKDNLLAQLKASEHLWSTLSDGGMFSSSGRPGCFVVIEEMVRRLGASYRIKDYSPTQFDEHFGGKKYLAMDNSVNQNNARELREQGYVLCPPYFAKIGMPEASSKLDSLDVAVNAKPERYNAKIAREAAAKESGVEVSFEEFDDVDSSEALLKMIVSRLASIKGNCIERPDRPGSFRIYSDVKISKELLSHPLVRVKTDDQKALSFLRGVAKEGLSNSYFRDDRAFLSQGEYVATFGVEKDNVVGEDMLLSRTTESKQEGGLFFEFDLDEQSAKVLRDLLSAPVEGLTQKETPAVGAKNKEKTDKKVVTKEKRSLEDVPVEQDLRDPRLRGEHKVVEASDKVQEKISRVAEKVPELTEVVDKLKTITKEIEAGESTENEKEGLSRIDKYLLWRESSDFYGAAEVGAGYLTGKNLAEIIEEHSRAEIDTVSAKLKDSKKASAVAIISNEIKRIADRLTPEDANINDFEIELAPTKEQLARLALLQVYVHASTGVAIQNEMFIYNGTGSKGLNIARKAIGLNSETINHGFYEAWRTMTHEVAHNQSMDHDPAFMHTMESLFAEASRKQLAIMEKLSSGQGLDESEQIMVDIQTRWEELREQEQPS